MGCVGGIIGASVGTLVVVGVAAYQTWTPVLDPLVPLVAPLIGATIGLLAGTYRHYGRPAWSRSRHPLSM